ncbi:MAG TPA: SusC/RagA family TonB-linked outer membrane protein [Petrimonas sp.]|uniref:SusC/RagA family TonB-linked outer membrane protein n=1 Tax=Petrimonas sp. TaxID=2023866 RepID=UPI00176B33A1|nr:SusC/RagA family TonB-linked outer membrane protein [Petrimonas sp.]
MHQFFYNYIQPSGGTLIVSYVGYVTQEVPVSDNVKIKLVPDTELLEEVIVTAIGISRKDKSLGYAVTNIKSDELLKARDANVINSLAGKVAGVRVSSSSGTVGGSSKIIIRGANSLDGNNQPLFVVDGVPIDNSSQGSASTNVVAGVADYGNRAGDLNSDDIESMSILKGAAASALYGARAKNGAVIITTKKGAEGHMNIEVNSSVRFETPLKLPDFQNEYAQGNYGVYDLKFTGGWGPKIADVQDQKFKNFLGEDVTLQAYPNNVRDFYETGHTYINSIAFSGGGKKMDYRVGVTAHNQTGIVPGMNMGKYTLSLNSGINFTDNFQSRTIVNYYNIDSKGRPAQSSNDPNVLSSAINGLPRTVDINQLRENWINPSTGEQISLSSDKTGNNPYWIVNKNKFTGGLERVILSETLTYAPVSWISVSNIFGLDFSTDNRKQITSVGTFGDLKGSYYTNSYYTQIINNDFMVTATRNLIPDLEMKVILGHNINQRYTEYNGLEGKELTVKDLYVPSNVATKVPYYSSSLKRLIGVYGDIGFAYRNFLYLNITGRNDWSSTLPIEHRSYFYPSVSSSFVFSELIPANDILSFGNLRLNWANVGSDEAPYQLDYVFSPATTYFSQYGLGGTFPFGDIATAFTVPRVIPSASLKPQNQRSFEIGTNLKFFKNRAYIDFTYYNVLTSNQIISLDIPLSTGYFAKKVNVGAISNKGIELAVGVTPVKTKNIDWTVDVNFAKNKQIVEKLVEDKPDMIYNLASGWSGLQTQARKGETFGLYGTKWKRNPDGEFIINQNTGLREVETGKFIGNIYPDWTMGINNSFTFYGVNLGFLVDIRQGGVMFSSTAASVRASGRAAETLENRDRIFIDKGVIDNGDGTYRPNDVPVQSMQDFWGWYSSVSNTEGSVFDASYVKLREVRLSYTLPASWIKELALQRAELGLEGRNLWIIKSHVPHIDPESNMFGTNSVAEAIEFNSVPSTKSIGFNVRLTF